VSDGHILVVDDEDANLRLFTRLLEHDGYVVSRARSGQQALDRVARQLPDLVLLDVMMPGLTGFETCRELKRNAPTRLIPVVLVTALQSTEDRIQGIEAGADDFLTKPFNSHELRARVRSLLRIKHYTDDLESADAVILSLALTIEARDAYTDGHCQRLAAYATALGRALKLSADDVEVLERGGFLHDIGKVGVPDGVLLKPGPLNDQEYQIIKQHPVIGDRLCGGMRSLKRVRPIVRHHHERLDGSGYPDGLAGADIPLLAQIISVVDLFDAVTTKRPYRAAQSAEHACAELRREVSSGWRSAHLVEVFIDLVTTDRLPVKTPL
jgi:putative two-component system response regulator